MSTSQDTPTTGTTSLSKTGKTYTVVNPITGATIRRRTNSKDRGNVYNVRHVDQHTKGIIGALSTPNRYGSAAAVLAEAVKLEYIRTKLREYHDRPPSTDAGKRDQARLGAAWDNALKPGGAE